MPLTVKSHSLPHVNDARFPVDDYTPHGYLDNPAHSAVVNPSGLFRSVPPLGFGFWCRHFHPYYGSPEPFRRINYLSLLHVTAVIDGVAFHTMEDFHRHGVDLVSSYHSKNIFSYDFRFHGILVSLRYLLFNEHVLLCLADLQNPSDDDHAVTLHYSSIYGFPESRWWGSDGFTARYQPDRDITISKIYAYGDVFALGADQLSARHLTTADEQTWEAAVRENALENGAEHASVQGAGPVYAVHSYVRRLAPGATSALTVSLARGANEAAVIRQHRESLQDAERVYDRKTQEDSLFYQKVPRLTGDWPAHWKRGFVYDIETLRMTIRPPVGIYQHPWDGMLALKPRQVLGETMLDAMCLSYTDIDWVKEIIYGTFADSPAPNIPCTREDGSVNMIGEDGSECGTAGMWGLPFLVVRSIYFRDRDHEWIRKLYPHLKAFIEWWQQNRTDEMGWFHCNNSWESGQDASRRFLIHEGSNEASNAELVRTVDVEAVMADAIKTMAMFADIIGEVADKDYFETEAARRIHVMQSMFVDGQFRDFDARTNQPIVIKDYFDIMMMVPFAVNLATDQQTTEIREKFAYFQDNPSFWLEWPSFQFPFTEAAWNVGLRLFSSSVVGDTCERVYSRVDRRQVWTQPVTERSARIADLPEQFRYLIPGVSNEMWPLNPEQPAGCENYGWGATLPTLMMRNIIGLREWEDPHRPSFVLAPAIPERLMVVGRSYGVSNLSLVGFQVDIHYRVESDSNLQVQLLVAGAYPGSITIQNDGGDIIGAFQVDRETQTAAIRFHAINGNIYRFTLVSLEGQ